MPGHLCSAIKGFKKLIFSLLSNDLRIFKGIIFEFSFFDKSILI